MWQIVLGGGFLTITPNPGMKIAHIGVAICAPSLSKSFDVCTILASFWLHLVYDLIFFKSTGISFANEVKSCRSIICHAFYSGVMEWALATHKRRLLSQIKIPASLIALALLNRWSVAFFHQGNGLREWIPEQCHGNFTLQGNTIRAWIILGHVLVVLSFFRWWETLDTGEMS